MAKKNTRAALALVSVKNNKAVFSTKGTQVAPGSKYKEWKIRYGDGAEVGGNTAPNEIQNHDYPILEPEPGLTEDSYDVVLEIKDNKGGADQAVVDNVIILRNPTNPTPPGLVITDVTPDAADVGVTVTLTGYGFGASQGGSTVTFDGTPAGIISWTDTLIKCTVPSIGTGTAIILVTVGALSGSVMFEVTGTPPTFDFYVTKSGNNSWNGLFPTFQGGSNGPKLTLTGAQGGIALLSAGKSLGVGTGVYEETITVCPSGTSWSNKVRIAAMSGAVVTLHADGSSFDRCFNIMLGHATVNSYIEFDGINCDASDITLSPGNYRSCIWLRGTSSTTCTHHIRVKNCEAFAGSFGGSVIGIGDHANTGGLAGWNEILNVVIHGGGTTGCSAGSEFECNCPGIYIGGNPNNLVDGCDIYDVGGQGIQIWNPSVDDDPSFCIVRNSRIHDITRGGYPGAHGIHLGETAHDCLLYNNLIYNIRKGGQGDGINTFSNPNNCKVWFNTIYNCDGAGMRIQSGTTGWELRDNIVYQNSGGNIVADSGTVAINTNNSASGVNPQFASPSTGNFHLTAATPPSIVGAGIAITNIITDPDGTIHNGVTEDFDGVTRGNPPDIGAYEKV